MADEMMLMLNDDGVAHVYDDTYDIVIHCESAEEQKEVEKRLTEMSWIPCSERLPDKPDVYLISSEGISVTVAFFADGKWTTPTCLPLIGVDAWMPLPEPWMGEEHG